MRIRREGKVIYLVQTRPNTIDMKCSNCGIIKNEDDIKVNDRGMYVCKCGSSIFIPLCDIEEYI